MKDVWKKIAVILLIVLFPIGMIYCIGKALFADKRGFAVYLGMLFIFIGGFALCVGIFWQDLPWMVSVVAWFKTLFHIA